MGFIDLGHKPEMGVDVPSKVSERIYYPSLHIDKKTNYITRQDIGTTITATVKLKVKSHEERVNDNGKETYSCNFDVLGIDFGEKSLDQKEQEEYERNPIKTRRQR